MDSSAENTSPKLPRRRRRRFLQIVSITVTLVLGGSAIGAAAASTESGRVFLSAFTGTNAPIPDARELPAPEPELDMTSPEFRALVDDWTLNPNLTNVNLPSLPAGTDTIAIPPGMTRDEVFSDLYTNLFPSASAGASSGRRSDSTPLTTVALSGLIDNQIVEAWYRYWLGGNTAARGAAQPILDSFQNSPDLWRTDLSHYDMPGSPAMIAIARIAEAARHNDGEPMRAWPYWQNPPAEPDDAYLDVASPEWHNFITTDTAAIPLPPRHDRRNVFAVLYDELPVPAGATWSHWRDAVGDRFAGSGLPWEQEGDDGPITGVRRSIVVAQPVLDSMSTWPALTRVLYRSGYNRIGKIEKIAQAARPTFVFQRIRLKTRLRATPN